MRGPATVAWCETASCAWCVLTWTTAGAERAPGIAQLFGLDLVLEQRDPIFTGR